MTLIPRRLPRLFLERGLDASSLTLDEREAHYLGHVLRLAVGDELVAFNGLGVERVAAITSLQRRGGALDLRAALTPLPESPLDLTLIQALPKADAMDLVVQKATELGVRAIVPVYADFSVVRLDAERSERRVDHWRKIARSACEQCGRHRPPSVAAPVSIVDAVQGLPELAARWALDPAAGAELGRQVSPRAGLVLAVGPEGGFSPSDWRRLEAARFDHVALGRRVLRAETAALAACAIAQSLWGDL
jgi:16S rRNA (uracil1498-N3)-methyltransferase